MIQLKRGDPVMKFWDREKEADDLKKHIKSEPNAILFVYGPKSSGKSTLLYQVVKKLSKRKWFAQKYDVYWYDLRGKMISSYKDVVDIFFRTEDTEAGRFISSVEREVNIGLPVFARFKVKTALKNEFYSKLADPFEYMEAVLRKSRKKHIVVFDELQKLKEVYINGENQRPVVKELFNFFVRLTKVLHLSHVIVMSSDTFFIEEVYCDSTLKNTSRYYLVDFFDDETAYNILVSEGIDKKTANEIVSKSGGVPWILEEILESDKPLETLKELYDEFLSKMYEAIRNREDLKALLKRAASGENLYYADEEIDKVKELAEKEILFYDPINRVVKFQTRLDELAAKELFENASR